MSVYNTNLCIGGPLDGQKYAHEHSSFRAPVLKKLELAPYPTPDDPDQVSHTVDYVTYNRVAFRASQHESITFWAADTETFFSALMRLLRAYEARRDIIDRADKFLAKIDTADIALSAGDFGKPGLMLQIERLRNDLRRFLFDLTEQWTSR